MIGTAEKPRRTEGRSVAGTVDVWDLPTRLFHWLLVVLVAVAWLSGESGREATSFGFTVHRFAAYGVLVLLAFRVVWGFVGSHHSRFADFLRPWPPVRDYLNSLLRFHPMHSLGHNPLGGWMVIALLATLAACVGTGLFASSREIAGPLAKHIPRGVSHEIGDVHEVLTNLLLFLVAIHVGAVAAYHLVFRDNLVAPMITGRKSLPAGREAAKRAMAPLWLAAPVPAAAVATVWYLINL